MVLILDNLHRLHPHGRRRTRERGGALVIATIMIVLTVSFAGILLGVPNAQLNRVGTANAKSSAKEAADAGIRDATIFLYANRASMNALFTATTTETNLAALPNGTFYPTVATLPALGAVTPTTTSNPGLAPHLVYGIPWIGGTFGGARGGYFYKIVARPNNYFEVYAVGTAIGGPGRFPTVTTIRAYLFRDTPDAAVPAAATFLDPSSTPMTDSLGNPVNTIYNTQSGGNPPSIVGDDAAVSSSLPGVAIQSPSITYGTGTAAIEGDPQPIVGGTYGSPPPQSTWDDLQSLIGTLRTAPDVTSGTTQVLHVTFPTGTPVQTGGTSSFQNGVLFIRIPSGSVVNSDLIVINGNNPITGIIVVDVEPNVTFESPPIYQKNGTSYFQGAFIVNQQGALTVPSAGLHFLDKNGNNPNFLQYNSVAVQGALQIALPIYRFASYVVK